MRGYPKGHEADAYLEGFKKGGHIERLLIKHETRLAAFAAIRRAAMFAREYETRAENAWKAGDEIMESECWSRAIVVRRTIRIAIGSDKI